MAKDVESSELGFAQEWDQPVRYMGEHGAITWGSVMRTRMFGRIIR